MVLHLAPSQTKTEVQGFVWVLSSSDLGNNIFLLWMSCVAYLLRNWKHWWFWVRFGNNRNLCNRDPWVAQRFGACLWPRAWSWRPGIKSHVGLPVHGAASASACLSLSVTIINKFKKRNFQTIIQSDFSVLHSYQRYRRLPLFSTSLSIIGFLSLFILTF